MTVIGIAVEDLAALIRREVEAALSRCQGPEELLTMAEAARRLGVSARTVQRWVRSGEIASTAVGRTRRIPASALDPEHPSTLRPPG